MELRVVHALRVRILAQRDESEHGEGHVLYAGRARAATATCRDDHRLLSDDPGRVFDCHPIDTFDGVCVVETV